MTNFNMKALVAALIAANANAVCASSSDGLGEPTGHSTTVTAGAAVGGGEGAPEESTVTKEQFLGFFSHTPEGEFTITNHYGLLEALATPGTLPDVLPPKIMAHFQPLFRNFLNSSPNANHVKSVAELVYVNVDDNRNVFFFLYIADGFQALQPLNFNDIEITAEHPLEWTQNNGADFTAAGLTPRETATSLLELTEAMATDCFNL